MDPIALPVLHDLAQFASSLTTVSMLVVALPFLALGLVGLGLAWALWR